MTATPAQGLPPQQRLASTQWSLVLAAADRQGSRYSDGLAHLAGAYWQALFAFARRRGLTPDAAEDAVQSFFARLMERDGLHGVGAVQSRFRAYLFGAFKNHLADARAHTAAQKRGGDWQRLSLDGAAAERALADLAHAQETPERAFERRWAWTVIERTLARMQAECVAAGKEALFARLKCFLVGDHERGDLRSTADEMAMSAGAVRLAVFRLRRRFADLLREEVASTVATADEIEAELALLLRALET